MLDLALASRCRLEPSRRFRSSPRSDGVDGKGEALPTRVGACDAMRVDTSEPHVTVVEDRPIFVPGFCLLFLIIGIYLLIANTVAWSWNKNDAFGTLICLAFGGGMFLYTARRDAYRFDRRSQRLDWTRRGLLGQSQGSIPFDAIERVAVHRGPQTEDTTCRVVLYITDGELFPLSNGYAAGERHHEEVAQMIEEALSRPAPQPVMESSGRG